MAVIVAGHDEMAMQLKFRDSRARDIHFFAGIRLNSPSWKGRLADIPNGREPHDVWRIAIERFLAFNAFLKGLGQQESQHDDPELQVSSLLRERLAELYVTQGISQSPEAADEIIESFLDRARFLGESERISVNYVTSLVEDSRRNRKR